MDNEVAKGLLGTLYFKKALYLITDFKDKSIVKGICVLVESSVQRGSIKVNVSGNYNTNAVQELNGNEKTFNAEIQLQDISIQLKDNGQYIVWSSDINFKK